MSQFVKAFRELSYAYSFIAECVSVHESRQQGQEGVAVAGAGGGRGSRGRRG